MTLAVDIVVSLLLVVSGVFALAGALGLVRLRGFMLRMHAPALGFTLGSWSVALALVVYFSAIESALSTHAILIVVFLAITVPITTLLLARAALFRSRQAGKNVPPSLAEKSSTKPVRKQPAGSGGRSSTTRR